MFIDKVETAVGHRVYANVMASMLIEDAAKQYVTDKYNVGREKKFHRKFKPAERSEVAAE